MTASNLKISSVFESIQTEGYWCGTPALFIRFAGCNLKCPACDAKASKASITYHPLALMEFINKAPQKHIVFTGGEPTLQLTADFINSIIPEKKVQIETNGVEIDKIRSIAYETSCFLTVSPKTPEFYTYGHEYKFIIGDQLPGLSYEQVGEYIHKISYDYPRLYYQPLDGNIVFYYTPIIKLIDKFGGRVSYPWHKLGGLK